MEPENNSELRDDQLMSTPVLPLRDVVVYPHMVIPLFVGRDKSIKALEAAMEGNKQILLVAQKSAALDDPQVDDIYRVGTLSSILQLLKLPDGTIKVLVEGTERARIVSFTGVQDYLTAEIVNFTPTPIDEREIEALTRSVLTHFDQYVKLNKKLPPEILSALASIDEPGRLADTVAAHMTLKLDEKQAILEMDDVRTRLEHLMGIMESEIDLLQVEKRIRGRVKRQMEKNQREYFLPEFDAPRYGGSPDVARRAPHGKAHAQAHHAAHKRTRSRRTRAQDSVRYPARDGKESARIFP